MRVALVRPTPYTGSRTMWREAASAMPELECLLDALARGQRQLAAQAAAAGAEALDRFGRPADPSLPYIIPK